MKTRYSFFTLFNTNKNRFPALAHDELKSTGGFCGGAHRHEVVVIVAACGVRSQSIMHRVVYAARTPTPRVSRQHAYGWSGEMGGIGVVLCIYIHMHTIIIATNSGKSNKRTKNYDGGIYQCCTLNILL